MKIETIDQLVKFLRMKMDKEKINCNMFGIYENGKFGLFVDIDVSNLTIDFIIFMGNCLKKYKDSVLYDNAV